MDLFFGRFCQTQTTVDWTLVLCEVASGEKKYSIKLRRFRLGRFQILMGVDTC